MKFSGDVDGTDEEQLEKLRTIANKIDTDQNGQISRDEMLTYIDQRIKFVSLIYIIFDEN